MWRVCSFTGHLGAMIYTLMVVLGDAAWFFVMSLGPGIPEPIRTLPVPRQLHRHRFPHGLSVVDRPILGGLHHDYRLEQLAA